ncbi:N-acetylmuramoyl-L-alanine amidase [Nocardioides ochotonae]|uniref:N-acetylmuramoyl-L-alanine amidase n=1 Tax=Nocardioides ochotonae TaxID=2685869 RepID=UPI00140D189C|nr:hypothetical protein [Nocardioides ochotonae]
MATYLETHRPRQTQFRRPRRATPSGVVVVHTAESAPDTAGPDTGAENVAGFIAGRTDYGSYHDLCDSDSIVHLVPYDAEAYGDGTGSNPHAYHVSAATQAHRWPSLSQAWREGAVRNMAAAAANYARWLRAEHGIEIPARRITRAQSEARVPGFLSHGERDPGRRTDPGQDFPWSLFLTTYADLMEDDDMKTEDFEKVRAIVSDETAKAVKPLADRLNLFAKSERARDKQVREVLRKVRVDIKDKATLAEVEALLAQGE